MNNVLKQFTAWLCAAVLLLAMLPTVAVSAATVGDFTYEVLGDGTAEITHYTGSATAVTVPATVGGYTVTAIGDYAFYHCLSLESVTIPDSVTTIGFAAFGDCTSLRSIIIPDGVTAIPKAAFHKCKSLQSITIPNSVTAIGEQAFTRCSSLESITIPDSVTTIENHLFSECTSLRSVTLPNSLTTIETKMFYECTSLRSIIIPNGVKTIAEAAFYKCTSLESITIPNSVTAIGEQAFAHCSSLRSITIPDGVKTIAKAAFYECTSLESLMLPKRVTEIRDFAFGECRNLKTVYYGGTMEQRYNIHMCDGNEALANAAWVFEVIKRYPDVSPDQWYYEAAEYVSKRGFMSGYASGLFGPAANMHRQDFVLILARVAGVDLNAYKDKTVTMPDVVPGSYYAAAVAWAAENGVVSGYQNGYFGVSDPITREQVCTILYRFVGSPEVENVEETLARFPDRASISEYAEIPTAWAVQNNVVSGMASGWMAPLGKASRAQVATIVMRMDQKGML